MNIFLLIISSVFTSTFFIIIFQRLFFKKNIIDKVNDRSSHNVVATRSGGIAVFASLFIISSFYYFYSSEIFDFSLIIPLSILLVVGLYDDIYNLDFKLKFIFQIIAAKIIIDNGLVIDNLHGILGIFEVNRTIAQLITIFFIVVIINSINFIDGIDGLAISIVNLFIILFEFFSISDTNFYYLSVIIIFSTLPLVYFNFKKKNKVFLGDSGSLFLGALISVYVLKILSQDYLIKHVYDMNKVLFVLSILTYPIVDIIRIVFLRIKEKKSPFEADKKHIHHLVLSKVKSHSLATIIIFLGSILIMIFMQFLFN
jgi:UDP-N-acetylmuramyl pentapeptide phosphotransferase/UDP-N-acetylglucosamine-1-phosphate transferase